MSPQLYIAGVKIETLAPISGLVISHEWGTSGVAGPVTATCNILLPAAKRPGWLVADALAEIRLGCGLPLLAGALAEPDWTAGTLLINAAATEGSTTACMAADQATISSIPDTILDAAKARGAITWARPTSISTVALTDGDQPRDLNSVTEMVDAYCDLNTNTRLYVDPYRQILQTTDPTSPGLYVVPGAVELAWTTQSQASRVFGRWRDSAGVYHTTSVGSGEVEQRVNLTPNGPLTSTQAITILTNILTRATAGGWTNGLTLTSDQIVGAPHLGMVADMVGRGLTVRVLGQRDTRRDRVPVGYVDVVIERSEWHVDDRQIILTPRGMVASDWASITAAAGVKAAA